MGPSEACVTRFKARHILTTRDSADYTKHLCKLKVLKPASVDLSQSTAIMP